MRNKIQIDEFVRQHTLDKDAQLNIGAWSNMERMLNGENPYTSSLDSDYVKPEKKYNVKKLLGLLLLLVAISSTALFTKDFMESRDQPDKQQREPLD